MWLRAAEPMHKFTVISAQRQAACQQIANAGVAWLLCLQQIQRLRGAGKIAIFQIDDG